MGISKFEAARRASGMSNVEAAKIAGFKEPTMYTREDDPGSGGSASWRESTVSSTAPAGACSWPRWPTSARTRT